jgi:hypothetical protein
MGDMSDLDLVAKAMEPTNQPDKTEPSKPLSETPTTTTKNGSTANDHSSLPTDNIDVSSLTPEDLAMLQPLLDALNIKDSDDLDDAALQDLLAQMDSAGDVADDLEGKLDKLIGELGSFEKGIVEDMGEKGGEKEDEERASDGKEKEK